MYGADYAWVLSGAPQDSWWRDTSGTNCTSAQLVEAVQGVVLVAAHGSIIGTNASESGLVSCGVGVVLVSRVVGVWAVVVLCSPTQGYSTR